MASSCRSSACSRDAPSLTSCSLSRCASMPADSSAESVSSSPGHTFTPITPDSASQCRPRMPGLQTACMIGT
eukprot:365830-Chlamydomonas_euryale.AAC.11